MNLRMQPATEVLEYGRPTKPAGGNGARFSPAQWPPDAGRYRAY
jgi:hypothetical protein